ncbi:hypothetical protein GCM10009827_084270 [Dactylosporangium maewongense]|uniref:N-acetyltransferase domain-containing protein n=1 Tax=Dactylosporangium maewongense TaxID=634393 RepID=A0ABN2C1P5_9ACTN
MTDFREPELLDDHHDISQFDCGKPQLNDWLQREALRAQRSGTARTYVWADEGRVVAYFAVCPTRIGRDELTSGQAGGVSVVPAYLLAKLALDGTLQGKGYGADLLADAMTTILYAADSAGGRIVVVDAIDDSAAAFYASKGFKLVRGNPCRLVAKIESVRKAAGEVDPSKRPGGLPVVGAWIVAVRAEQPSRPLWALLDDPLRLALAQGWIMHRAEQDSEVARRDRVDLAHALTPVDASHPLFVQMITDLHQFWRSVYAAVLHESGVWNKHNLVAPGMEMVFLTPPQYIGLLEAPQAIPSHCFITRYVESGSWLIAALARRLPVPGWPPSERELPGWESEPLA